MDVRAIEERWCCIQIVGFVFLTLKDGVVILSGFDRLCFSSILENTKNEITLS